MNDDKVLLAAHHRSALLKTWVGLGCPKIVIMRGFHDGAWGPAETVIGLGKALRVPMERRRLFKVLRFFNWGGWSRETWDDWMEEFPEERRILSLQRIKYLIINNGGEDNMADFTPDELKIIVEANGMTMEALLDRVIKGNDRLMDYYGEIKKEKDTETWNSLVDNLHVAVERLELLTEVLAFKGYHDCFYIKDGVRTRRCLDENKSNIVCWACLSDKKYWETELFGTGTPLPYRTRKGERLMRFIKAGGKL
ncbi:MAG: hypothetical protein V1767_00825 [Chloroflexota bacterium]